MRPRIVPHEDQGHLAEAGPADCLVATRFDRAFRLLRLFSDDTRQCLELAAAVIRALSESDVPCAPVFYTLIVDRIRGLEHAAVGTDGLPCDSLLCLLLKEHVGLSYAEIAAALGIDRAAVRDHIAAARMAVLG